MRAIFLLAILCPLLQGCVGVAVLKPKTTVISDPVISSYPNDADPVHERKSSEATNAVVYTSEWLQTHWGSPNRVSRTLDNSDAIWTYTFRPIWEGVTPFVIIPVPLMLPTEKQKVSFVLHDGYIISARTTEPWMVGCIAGFSLSPEGGGNFGGACFNAEAPN